MKKPSICAVITSDNPKAIKAAESLVDLFEVRLDLIGEGWPEVAKQLRKPWIACNRTTEEGGQWAGNEARRIEGLLQAIELEADIIDIELRTNNLDKIISMVKKRAKCLLSYHDLAKTPPLDEMKGIVQRQLKAGADICKVVTTAREFKDNLTMLQLITEFPGVRLVSLAMGPLGVTSRILSPLVGGEFTYASIEPGKESAPGQIMVADLTKIYEMLAI